MIDGSNAEVARGVSLSRRTADSLVAIQSTVAEMASLVDRICGSCTAQEGGVSEFADTIARVDEITRANTEMALDTSGTVRRLVALSDGLARSVGFFEIGDIADAAAAADAPVAARAEDTSWMDAAEDTSWRAA